MINANVASVLVTQLEYSVPSVNASVKRTGRGCYIVATVTRRGRPYTININSTQEFGLVMALLENTVDKTGKTFTPMPLFTSDRGTFSEYELEQVG